MRYCSTSFLVGTNLTGGMSDNGWGYRAVLDATSVFNDISTTGESLWDDPSDRDWPVTLGDEDGELDDFSFNFYGNEQTSVCVSAHGFVYFGNEIASTTWYNYDLDWDSYPYSDCVGEMTKIAVLWDQWELETGSDIFWELQDGTGGKELIIQWNNMVHADSSSSETVTFQLVLFEDGTMRLSYDDIDMDGADEGNGGSATVGTSSLWWSTNDTNFTAYPLVEAVYSDNASSNALEVEDDYLNLVWDDDIGGNAYDLNQMASGTSTFLNLAFAHWTLNGIIDQLPEIEITTAGGVINDSTPLVEGIAEPGGTVTLYADGYIIGTTTADSNGDWSIEAATPMGDQAYTLIATSTNTDGYELNVTDPLSVTVEAVAPTVTEVILNGNLTQRHNITDITFILSESVTVSSNALEIWWHNDTSWEQVDISSASFTSGSNEASWDLDGLLEDVNGNIDGHYMAILLSSGVEDIANNNLDGGDYLFNFHQLAGDLDGDGAQGAGDLDAIADVLESPSGSDLWADLDGDLDVDQEDMDELVEDIFHTYYGDAKLDGNVDIFDFLVLKSNYGEPATSWAEGDFDTNDGVDILDFLILKGNYGSVEKPDFGLKILDIANPPAWV